MFCNVYYIMYVQNTNVNTLKVYYVFIQDRLYYILYSYSLICFIAVNNMKTSYTL